MRRIPKIRKKAPLFHNRMIITIPAYGIPVFTCAVCAAIVWKIQTVATAICVIFTACAAIAVWAAYRQLNEMRHQVHNILHDIENLEFHEHTAPAPEVVREDAPPRISVKR